MNLLDRLRGYGVLRTMLRALSRRIDSLASYFAGRFAAMQPCARCGAFVDIETERQDGPLVVERSIEGKTLRVLVCHWCETGARRDGWKPPKSVAANTGEKETAA